MNLSKQHPWIVGKMRQGILISLLLLAIQILAFAQTIKPVSIKKIDKQSVVNTASQLLKEQYLHEEVGIKMGELLKEQLDNGAYDDLKTTREFARAMTNDLQSNFQDRHIKFTYDPRTIKMITNSSNSNAPNEEDLIQELLAIEIYENFRLPEVRHIRGNIGYLKIDMILPPRLATGYEEKIAAAMELMADTDAVIIDLRDNVGGWTEGNRLLLSYFLPSNTHIMNSISRIQGKTSTTKEYTRETVKGRTLLTQPIYLLVSNKTASAAESMAHALKFSGRAKLIGETTYGAGYSFDDVFVDKDFILAMPNAMGMHPKANENWESIGLKPDIEVVWEQSLERARLLAVTDLLNAELAKPKKERYKYRVDALTWEKDRLTDLQTPLQLSQSEREAYLGDYGPRSISLKEGTLYHTRSAPRRPASKLTPVKPDEFLIEGLEDYRMYFERDKNGKVQRLRMRSLTRLYIEERSN